MRASMKRRRESSRVPSTSVHEYSVLEFCDVKHRFPLPRFHIERDSSQSQDIADAAQHVAKTQSLVRRSICAHRLDLLSQRIDRAAAEDEPLSASAADVRGWTSRRGTSPAPSETACRPADCRAVRRRKVHNWRHGRRPFPPLGDNRSRPAGSVNLPCRPSSCGRSRGPTRSRAITSTCRAGMSPDEIDAAGDRGPLGLSEDVQLVGQRRCRERAMNQQRAMVPSHRPPLAPPAQAPLRGVPPAALAAARRRRFPSPALRSRPRASGTQRSLPAKTANDRPANSKATDDSSAEQPRRSAPAAKPAA